MKIFATILILLLTACVSSHVNTITLPDQAQTDLPVSAPITTESAGISGQIAVGSVFRVICSTTAMGGTGFLHRSGNAITAAHVVADCDKSKLILLLSSGATVSVESIIVDSNRDVALIKPTQFISAPSLTISNISTIPVGSKVSTWGFPSGYNGLLPLLTVGYLSGIDQLQTAQGLTSPRWVVNAAFNGGNSGGPVLSIEDGTIIGVVSSKLAPIPPFIENALKTLSKVQFGLEYIKTNPDGSKVTLYEGQVVAEVLKYLRSQTQLVLGHAVTSTDLRAFLTEHQIEP